MTIHDDRNKTQPPKSNYSLAFQAARSADSNGRSRPSQKIGHNWNHFSRLAIECTERLCPRSTYEPIVRPCAFSYDRIIDPVARGSPTTFAVRGSSRKQ